METKQCPACGKTKQKSDFSKNAARYDGLQAQCKQCKKASDAKHYSENKEKQLQRNKDNRKACLQEVAEYKAKSGCKVCGERESCCLDFHHPNDDKETGVSVLACAACRNKLWKEIAKCVVVCANCHRKIHAGLITFKGE